MTVPSTPQSVQYACTGGTEYPFAFPINDIDEIVVYLIDSGNNRTALVYGTNYSVTGIPIDWDISNNPIRWDFSQGGTVTTVVAYGYGNGILIASQTPLTQESVFTENMPTLYKTFERGLDKLTIIDKELEIRIIALELAIAIGTPVSPTDLNYLGKLAADPDYSGWNTTQAGWTWHVLVDDGTYRGRYWNGTEILTF